MVGGSYLDWKAKVQKWPGALVEIDRFPRYGATPVRRRSAVGILVADMENGYRGWRHGRAVDLQPGAVGPVALDVPVAAAMEIFTTWMSRSQPCWRFAAPLLRQV